MSGCLSGRARGDVEGTCPGWAEGAVWNSHSLPASCSFPWLYLMVGKGGSEGFPLCERLHPRSTLGRLMGNSPRTLPFHKTSVPISPKAKQSFGNALLGHGDEGSEGLGMWKLGAHHSHTMTLAKPQCFQDGNASKNIQDFIFLACGSPWPGGRAFGEAVAQQRADRGPFLPMLVLLECNAARFSVLNTLYFYPDAIIHPKVAGRVAGGAGCCLEMRGGCSQPSCFLSQVCDFPQHHFAAVIHAPGLPPSPLPMFPIS